MARLPTAVEGVTDPRLVTAFHEASHSVMAYLCGYRVEVASIRPSEAHAGVVLYEGDSPGSIEALRARRNQESFLGRVGLVPTPLFPTELRRCAEASIMVCLAGPIGEELAGPQTGYLADSPHEAEAIELAAEITQLWDFQRQALEHAERPDPNHLSDEAQAYDKANDLTAHLTARQLEAAAHVRWLREVTWNLVFTKPFADLVETLVPVLLQHEVLAGEHVTSILDKATEKRRHLRAVARDPIGP
jgi:hypothetical protein